MFSTISHAFSSPLSLNLEFTTAACAQYPQGFDVYTPGALQLQTTATIIHPTHHHPTQIVSARNEQEYKRAKQARRQLAKELRKTPLESLIPETLSRNTFSPSHKQYIAETSSLASHYRIFEAAFAHVLDEQTKAFVAELIICPNLSFYEKIYHINVIKNNITKDQTNITAIQDSKNFIQTYIAGAISPKEKCLPSTLHQKEQLLQEIEELNIQELTDNYNTEYKKHRVFKRRVTLFWPVDKSGLSTTIESFNSDQLEAALWLRNIFGKEIFYAFLSNPSLDTPTFLRSSILTAVYKLIKYASQPSAQTVIDLESFFHPKNQRSFSFALFANTKDKNSVELDSLIASVQEFLLMTQAKLESNDPDKMIMSDTKLFQYRNRAVEVDGYDTSIFTLLEAKNNFTPGLDIVRHFKQLHVFLALLENYPLHINSIEYRIMSYGNDITEDEIERIKAIISVHKGLHFSGSQVVVKLYKPDSYLETGVLNCFKTVVFSEHNGKIHSTIN